MKRIIVVTLLCVALAGTAFAVPQNQKLSTSPKQVMVDRNNDGKIDGVDIYDDSGKVVKRGYDTNGDGFVERWESYDENSGMPIVTQSDKAFELK